jgi:hypothetical protein
LTDFMKKQGYLKETTERWYIDHLYDNYSSKIYEIGFLLDRLVVVSYPILVHARISLVVLVV